MATAIELYREAYELDYRKGNWEAAEDIYKQIIKKYPHSDEKEYSEVHLDRIEKLRADPDDRELKPSVSKEGSSSGALSIVNFILIIVLLLVVCVLSFFLWESNQNSNYHELLLQGQLNEKSGDIKNAAAIYEFGLQTYPNKTLAYRFLAELHLTTGNLKTARTTYNKWQLAHLKAPGLVSYNVRLKNAEAALHSVP